MPLCPSWADFIEHFYKAVQQDWLADKERQEFAALKRTNDYEAMLDLLFKATDGLVRENLLKEAFLLKPDVAMRRKLALLHAAFPGLMITTNIDNLVFQTAPDGIPL